MNQKIKDKAREKICHEICCCCIHKPLKIEKGLFEDSAKTLHGFGECWHGLEGGNYCQIAIKSANAVLSLSGETDEVCDECKGSGEVDNMDEAFPCKITCHPCKGTGHKLWHIEIVEEE